MSKKQKTLVLIFGVFLLLPMICIILDLLFSTVNIFISGDYGYKKRPEIYTLYFDKALVRSKVSWSAYDNSFIRLLKLPDRICIISQNDSSRIHELRRILKVKESDLDRDFIKQFQYQVVYVGGNRHYIMVIGGTPEAVELYDMFHKYIYPK